MGTDGYMKKGGFWGNVVSKVFQVWRFLYNRNLRYVAKIDRILNMSRMFNKIFESGQFSHIAPNAHYFDMVFMLI